MLTHVTATSHIIGAGAFLIAIALILASRAQHRYKALLLVACTLSALWAGAIAASALMDSAPLSLNLIITVLEQARTAAWIGVVAFVLYTAYGQKVGRGVAGLLGGVIAAGLLYGLVVPVITATVTALPVIVGRGVYLAHVAVAISAVLLIENLFRNSRREARWSVKYLCFGLGVIFSYDLFVHAQAALLGNLDPEAYAARGLIQAIAMPLIIISAARSKSWTIDVHVSRNFVFHSATLLAAGLYLVVMAAAGYSLRLLDSGWGTVSQSAFMAASLLLLAAVLSSGEAQARLRSFINQNFFTYKYDYRVEWLRFIDSISSSADNYTIPERVLHGLANIIGSTSGKIWVKRDEDKIFHAVGAWNMDSVLDDVEASDPWISALAECPDAIDLRRKAGKNANPLAAQLPDWLSGQPKGLVLLPLVHGEELIGWVLLGEMRAPRAFNWEDLQILKTAARQAASYVAEERSASALAQVRRFEEFNQRFAFIVHDVKNLAAQMTLILRNAERHGNNPEFQRDMLQTVSESVSRLRGMMEQLKNPRTATAMATPIELVELLHDIADDWRLQIPHLQCDLPNSPININGQAEPLRAVICHLLQNAMDAAGADANISLELHIEGVRGSDDAESPDGKCWAVVTVADDGPGMDKRFVENGLFQPLKSTKSSGFGIGAFQARQVARDMGGRLDIESQAGRGTRVAVRLPFVLSVPSADIWKARPYDKTTALLRTA